MDVYRFNLKFFRDIQPTVASIMFRQLYQALEWEDDRIKTRHKKKILQLQKTYDQRFGKLNKQEILQPKIEIINLTQKVIPTNINDFLNQGPKTAVSQQLPTSLQYLVQAENIIKKVNEPNQSIIRQKFINMYQKQLENCNNLKQENSLNKTRQWLRNNQIIMLQADKSANMVLIEQGQYRQKFNEMVNVINLQIVEQDETENLIKNVNNVKKLKYLPKEIKDKIKVPYNPRIPQLFTKIKIHKDDAPLRPIVAKYTAPTFLLEKALAAYFKVLIYPYKFNVRSSTDFVNELMNIKLNSLENITMYTVDVKNLYPSVNLSLAKQLILKKYRQQINSEPKVIKALESALNLVLNNNYAQHNSTIYLQKTGAPLGSPLSETFAEITLQTLEENVIHEFIQQGKLVHYKRYVDDVFILWKGTHQQFQEDFLNKLNNIFSFIKFTFEQQSPQNTISFLDVLIYKYSKVFQTTVFRKTSYSPSFIPAKSQHPFQYKISAMKTLIYRAFNICSNKYFLSKEIRTLRKQFIDIGYTNRQFFQVYNKVKTNIFPPTNLIPDNQPVNKSYLPLQYFQPLTGFLTKEVNRRNSNLQIIPVVNNTIAKLVRQRETIQNKAGIYFIPLVNQHENKINFYIGETARTINARRSEHSRNVIQFLRTNTITNSAIISFIFENPETVVKFQDMSLLYTPRSQTDLLFIESVYLLLYKNLACNNPTFPVNHLWQKHIMKNKRLYTGNSQIEKYIYNNNFSPIADHQIPPDALQNSFSALRRHVPGHFRSGSQELNRNHIPQIDEHQILRT